MSVARLPFILLKLILLLSLYSQSSAAVEQVSIPAGSFHMGCASADNHCQKDEGPRGGVEIFVDTFSIDRHEASVADYRRCVTAGACSHPKDFNRNHYCNYDAPGRDNHPLNCVDWQQANSYCQWRGGRLAYEAEWEKAARAGTNSRYPWGNHDATCKHAIMDDQKTKGLINDEYDGCGNDQTWSRGSRPANAYGLYDMHGGVAEWVNNWYEPTSHSDIYPQDISAPKTGVRKVIRGGAWDEQSEALTSSSRWAKPPTGHPSLYGSNGIRCVNTKR
ncbi:formylglycine-generating enzyme family protein [Sulfuriflexus mobilis]|uniref:formylglycine-generating enzyme family protein n=1 Tax=Sulfuriflexus mobilis TaxID=1811807 RepID=UPI000F83270D|nr:SUMF1/EgtB/PvdO family nonheme iron enzyme [Sulfuriflexus mobilis]